jgi:glyoxylase-like metal-dependent hydrolase (beta-lactamase superfamily II)
VERNLYWVTDGTYQAAFLTTRDGVVLFDAPPTIGQNLQRAIDQIASSTRVSNKVTHIVYSHHHADHVGASSLFGSDVVRVGHIETKRLLSRDSDLGPPVPLPDITFETHRTLHVGGERIDLAWLGTNHTPDNIYIHFPRHDTLMLVDINLPGWAPYDSFNVNEDVPGSIAAYQQYVSDLIDSIKKAVVAVDPTPFFTRYGNNSWAAVQAYQAAQVDYAAAPVIKKYTGVLAAADVYTASTAFILLESIRLDQGFGSQIHP